MRGHNTKKPNPSDDTIRQGTIYSFVKAPHALSDAMCATREGGDIWRDWSEEVRRTPTAEPAQAEAAALGGAAKL